MLDLVLLAVLSLVSCLAGVVCGLLLRTDGAPRCHTPNASNDPQPEKPASQFEQMRLRVCEAAKQLQSVAAGMKSDCDEHQACINAIDEAIEGKASLVDTKVVDETISRLARANDAMQLKLRQAEKRIEDQASQLRTIEQQSITDGLTQLRNRQGLDLFLKDCHSRRQRCPSTLMLLDIDRFKQVNDTLGHLAGDQVLRQVASSLNSSIGSLGCIARFGGEEFAVVFAGMPLVECVEAAEQARRDVSERELSLKDHAVRVTLSAGIAELECDESLAAWMERVDDALYRAKSMGRDRSFWMDGAKPIPVSEDGDATLPDDGPLSQANSASAMNLQKAACE